MTRGAVDQRLPSLSVVIPNYNHGRYLAGALERHVLQTVSPREILVVDDASTDDSCAVVEAFAAEHPSVRLIRLRENIGVNAVNNLALTEVDGECVCFSAADDLVRPEFAGRSLALLARHPGAPFCFSDGAETVGDSGVVQALPLRLSRQPAYLEPATIEDLMRRNFFSVPGPAVVYRRSAIVGLGGFDERLRWYADWFANCVLAFREGACYVPEVLAVCRVSPASYFHRGMHQTALQRDAVFRFLALLSSGVYQDVRPAFRRSALVPELRARVLLWVLASPEHRAYLTPRLAARLLVRGLWWGMKPYMPARVRPTLRWAARRWAQVTSAGGTVWR